jgi:hypothetical protein
MATVHVTSRDVEIFSALERCPLTVRQLRRLSVTFCVAFGSDRRMQDRLAALTRSDLLHRFRYASMEGSGQFYYTLSPEGYRVLHGHDAQLPSPGMFRETGIARQHHTHCLSEFLVHTLVAAHRAGIDLAAFHRENALRLSLGEEHLYPDSTLTLTLCGRTGFTFYIELDNSTEPLTSPREHDSWVRKLRFYEAHQDRSDFRFRVLGLITKSPQRLRNLLSLAESMARNRQRSLFYGVSLPDYLASEEPLTSPLFTDHRGQRLGLLPASPLSAPPHAKLALSASA